MANRCARCAGPVINVDHVPEGEYETEFDSPLCAKGNGWEVCPFTRTPGDCDSYDEATGMWLGELFVLN